MPNQNNVHNVRSISDIYGTDVAAFKANLDMTNAALFKDIYVEEKISERVYTGGKIRYIQEGHEYDIVCMPDDFCVIHALLYLCYD